MISEPEHVPWIGEAWDRLTQRLCIVGDSHYVTNPADDCEHLTIDIIRDVRDGRRHYPFYTRAAALIGDLLEEEGDKALWDRIAFFNFVPTSVGTESSAAPSAAHWEAGAQRFIRLLAELRPTHVLSLGQRQWNHISFPPGWQSISDARNPDIRLWTDPAGQLIVATWVNHPSSRGFSIARWRPRAMALLGTTAA